MSFIIQKSSRVTKVVGATVKELTLHERSVGVHFTDDTNMRFPLPVQVGGNWEYAFDIGPGAVISAAWVPNPAYIEGGSEPEAYFRVFEGAVDIAMASEPVAADEVL